MTPLDPCASCSHSRAVHVNGGACNWCAQAKSEGGINNPCMTFVSPSTPMLDRDRFLERIAVALEKAIPLLEKIANRDRGIVASSNPPMVLRDNGLGGPPRGRLAKDMCAGCGHFKEAHIKDTGVCRFAPDCECPGFI